MNTSHLLAMSLAVAVSASSARALADEQPQPAPLAAPIAPLTYEQQRSRAWAWSLTLMSAAGLGVFAWQGLRARDLDRDAAALTYGAPGSGPTARAAKTAARIADGGLLAAAASALPAAILWIKVEL